ncbi:uncharacterized protein C1orf131 homolog isoform X1 [Ambystoma mexicanum]|uniref:uncharacterized protein C1orf131 homolog isoform X1 n=1 Tax=Ambystoma mexicanum TaxID=8296 RepID=UPI0037E8FC99
MADNESGDEEGGVQQQRCLDSVLSRLYDFGETFSAKNQKKAAGISVQREESKHTGKITISNDKVVCSNSTLTSKKKRGASDFFETLKDELCQQFSDTKCSKSETERASDSAAATCEKKAGVEVVRFLSQKEKKKAKLEAAQDQNTKMEANVQEKDAKEHLFSLEKARLEVHRFGITGYKKEKQRTFEQERAIMLGAKPPKKQYLNYKVYQDQVNQKKIEKREESIKESDSSKKKKKRGKEERWAKKRKSSSTILPSGQVGKFKNGALLLSGKDIKKIKSSKVVK